MREEGMDGYEWNEAQPKYPLRRIIKWIIYAITALVYLVLMVRFIGSCDAGFSDKIVLDSEAMQIKQERGELGVRRIDLETDEDDDGRIQPQFVIYLEESSDFQVTLKCNSRYYPVAQEKENYAYALRLLSDDKLIYFPVTHVDTTKRLGYDYVRLCFDGIELGENDSLSLLIFRSADPVLSENSQNFADATPLFTCKVYANDCYSKRIEPSENDYIFVSSK